MVRRGWIRITGFNHHKIGYYLTPKGFAEKAKLTLHMVSWNVKHYSTLKEIIAKKILEMQKAGIKRVVFYGISDEMEVAYVTLQGANMRLLGIVEDEEKIIQKEMFGFELKNVSQMESLKPDAVLITSLSDQDERMETLKRYIDGQQIRIYNI
jgi:hypothetical protein